MIKSLVPAGAVLLCSAVAFAAGGGAGGGGTGGGVGGAVGAAGVSHHSGPAHRGSSLANPIENSTLPDGRARAPCIGAVAGAPTSGAPYPIAPATTTPSPTNGLAFDGTVQRNPDLPRLTQQDQAILAAIKQANEKLGEVGNPPNRRTDRQPSRPAAVIGTNDGIQRRDIGRSHPLGPLALGDSSAVKETTDPRSIGGKPDVNHMSEESQRLAREIIQGTEKLGRVGNPSGIPAGSIGDSQSDINGPHRPVTTVRATSRSC
jgi:hypothetical protein